MEETGRIAVALTHEEVTMLVLGLTDWGGPVEGTDSLAVQLGFSRFDDLEQQGERIAAAIATGEQLPSRTGHGRWQLRSWLMPSRATSGHQTRVGHPRTGTKCCGTSSPSCRQCRRCLLVLEGKHSECSCRDARSPMTGSLTHGDRGRLDL